MLTPSVGVAAFNCIAKDADAPPKPAERVAVCAEVTDATVAVNEALAEPAGTMIEAGTVTMLLLLARLTLAPPLAAAVFKVAVQALEPEPVKDAVLQDSPLNATVPVPLRTITVDDPVDELLERLNCPVTAPAAVGSNCTARVIVCAGFKVTGNAPPEIVKPTPVSVAELTVTGRLPVELNVNCWLIALLTIWFPNAMLPALTLSVCTAAFSCRATDDDVLPTLAVKVAVCVVLTDATVAVNDALEAPAATVTRAGAVTATLLLATLTFAPPLGAAAFNVTLQASDPEPVKDELAQESPLATTVPVPLKLSAVAEPVDESLAKISEPAAAPANVGSNCTATVAD